ncbi:molybdenum cofactor guanylyltransferase [Peribacillus kribbensis]|uniref:molybdenum cofactor guanylyltransferase n=1 Tax=Peribacillus kribbensis TaxID=356658 RepID=UPI00041353B6|nr:molybdenum cofactor guanylyltransferase [Peribacillus kribbensis]
MNITGIIIAGGKSSRMGTNKALLDMNGRLNIERTIAELSQVSEKVIIVTNDRQEYEFLGLDMVSDEYPGLGPLAGLHAGLKAAETGAVLAAACDMPFIKAEILSDTAGFLKGFEAAVPKMDGRPQPLAAGYRKESLSVLEDCLESGQLRMRDFLDRLKVKWVQIEDYSFSSYSIEELELMFFNMNHPWEYEKALRIAGGNAAGNGHDGFNRSTKLDVKRNRL